MYFLYSDLAHAIAYSFYYIYVQIKKMRSFKKMCGIQMKFLTDLIIFFSPKLYTSKLISGF